MGLLSASCHWCGKNLSGASKEEWAYHTKIDGPCAKEHAAPKAEDTKP